MAKQNSSFTAREQDVLVLIAQGRTAQQIGDTLGIVKRTVHAHASSIVEILNAANLAHAVALATNNKILEANR